MKARALAGTILYICLATAALSAPRYPLQAAPDGRQIVDQSGWPIFFHAATPWHILTRLDQDQTRLYLDQRRDQGFNSLLLSILVDDGFWTGSTNNVFGEPPFLSPGDFSAPNEAYFAHVDWFLQEAESRGFTVFLCPAYIGWECNSEGFCQDMIAAGAQVMRDYGRWLGNRYKDQPNIVWVNGGDADAAAYGALDEVDALAQGILETDPNHLHTGHCNRFNSGVDCYDLPWLDLNNTYADCSRTPIEVRQDYQRGTVRPFFYIEGRYEFESNATDVCMRSQAYWSLLGGAMGHFFGSGRIWDFPSNWQTGLDTNGTRSMQHFGKLLRSRRWNFLVPDYDHTVLVAGYDDISTSRFAAAARTFDGNTVIVYTPTQRTLTIAMDRISGEKAVGWWFDPRTGESSPLGSFNTTGSVDFVPPASGDWVLVLDNEDSNFDPPGQTDIFVANEESSFGALKGTYD